MYADVLERASDREIWKSLTEVSGPSLEPLSLAEAKEHLRVTGSDEDALIASLITVARMKIETMTRRALLTKTLELALDEFPSASWLALPIAPLQSVTSVKYTDSAGSESTFSDYLVDSRSTPGRIILAYNKSWPTVALLPGAAVVIKYIVGWADIDQIPTPLIHAMRLLLGHFYTIRESVIDWGARLPIPTPFGVERLVAPYKVPLL